MSPLLNDLNNLGFQLTHALTPGCKGYILPGAESIIAVGESGSVFIQNIVQPDFKIHFQVYDLLNPLQFPARQEKVFLVAFLALKNSIQYFIKGLGRFNLKQGQFALFRTKEQDSTISFEKSNSYHSLEISWSEEMVKQTLPHFSSVKPLFERKKNSKSYYLNPPGQSVGGHALR